MKKLLLLSTLLTAMSLQAQTTYYWPGERATELQDQSQYFIYNTTFDYNAEQEQNKDRSYFLYSDGSALKTNNISPKDFMTTDAAYLFKTVRPEALKADNHWYIHSAHGILGVGGQTNNTEVRDIYISKWFGNDNILKAGVKSEDENGEYQMPDEIDTHVWAITSGSDKNPNPNDNSYAWNGNAMPNAGLGSAWTRWANAHPYAFYTIESKELPLETDNAYKALNELVGNYYNLQLAMGLITDASQLSTNAQEQSEGPIAGLIDGNENTYFHSAYNNDPTPEGTNHYIQVALNEPIKSFYFCTKKRTSNSNNRPTEIKILVSQDGESFTELTTVSDGLVAHASDYMSPKIESETEFKYVRFEVMKTNTSTKFFTYSEFYMLDAAEYAKVEAVKDIDFIKTKSVEEIQQTSTELYNSISNVVIYKELQVILANVKAINWGSGVNQYTKPENLDAIIAEAEALTPSSSAEAIQEAKENLNNILASITLNQPEAGKYYRIKSKTTGKYIVSYAESGRPAMQEDGSDQTTVFYLSADNRLTGYTSLNMSGNGNFYNDGGHPFNFTASPITGYYTIRQTSNANGYLMDYSATNGKLDNWSNANDERCAWILEEVNEPAQQPKLNKQMTAEYATLAAPVALNIPTGVKAYTVTVDEAQETAILEEVNGVIPAGTAVILKKESDESSFDFTYAPEGSTENSNSLVGVYKATNVAADINAYILGNGSKGIGFYQMSADDRTLGANKAYLALSATMNHVRSITIGGPTTGIEDAVAEGVEAEEYYDLQGRRVMNPVKGIYVTKSGKKVIFNK